MVDVVNDIDPPCFPCTGELVWRRHVHPPPPSRHAIRNTCMELLPLVEMYCKWELQEDCSNLRALMLRFDLEEELESHAFGRSLLFMVRDDEGGIDSLPRSDPVAAPTDHFWAVRERLAAADSAIQGLQQHVHPFPHLSSIFTIPNNVGVSLLVSPKVDYGIHNVLVLGVSTLDPLHFGQNSVVINVQRSTIQYT